METSFEGVGAFSSHYGNSRASNAPFNLCNVKKINLDNTINGETRYHLKLYHAAIPIKFNR